MSKSNTRRWIKWAVAAIFMALVLGGAGLFLYSRLQPRHEYFQDKGALYLESGKPGKALENFRKALKEKSDFRLAQSGIIMALRRSDRFEDALDELDELRQMGEASLTVKLRRADILVARADYTLETAAENPEPDFYESVARGDIAAAIQLVKEAAEETEKPAPVYTELGRLYMRKSNLLGR